MIVHKGLLSKEAAEEIFNIESVYLDRGERDTMLPSSGNVRELDRGIRKNKIKRWRRL